MKIDLGIFISRLVACIGSTLAIYISTVVNGSGSILWSIVHGILGWFYVLYHILTQVI